MIAKVVKRYRLGEDDEQQQLDDLLYWLGKTSAERVEAVDILRRQFDGVQQRLQRSVTFIQRTPC